jgi:TPR repeat protein
MRARAARRAPWAPWPRARARLAAGLAALGLVVAAVPATAQTYRDAARLYDGGEVARAAAMFRELARDGNVPAQVSLAGMYANGDLGGARNDAKAVRWYRKAAEAGSATAQLNLGEMLAAGRGAPRDPVMAWVWLKRAAAQGRDWAARRAESLAAGMTADQRARARARLTASDAHGSGS